LLLVGCLSNAHSESPRPQPRTLDECYLQVAQSKSNADAAYVAREICDAVFGSRRRSLYVHDTQSGACVEWWLDKRGRYETHALYCVLEPAGGLRWTFACQDKSRAARFTLVDLREEGDRYDRVGDVQGVDPGPMFKTMAACVRYKAGGR
jgi:hypothetical protein